MTQDSGEKLRSMCLNITIRETAKAAILDLSGRIVYTGNRTDLRDAIRAAVAGQQKNVLLNFADVSHVDSSGLGQLVGGYATVKNNGGQIKLLNVRAPVHEILQTAKLLTVFETYNDETEAIRSFHPAP